MASPAWRTWPALFIALFLGIYQVPALPNVIFNTYFNCIAVTCNMILACKNAFESNRHSWKVISRNIPMLPLALYLCIQRWGKDNHRKNFTNFPPAKLLFFDCPHPPWKALYKSTSSCGRMFVWVCMRGIHISPKNLQ